MGIIQMKLAFIGFRHPHIHALYQHALETEGVDIVAACEEDAATRAALEQNAKVQLTHDNWQTMLDTVECDIVAVGDYFARRGSLILALLDRGKHVIVDKPVCTDLAALDAIAQKIQSSGLKVGCMLDMRDTPQVVGLRTLIRSGLIGAVHAIAFGGQHPLLLGSRASWYFEPGKHGGTINDIAIHAVDALPWITGLQFTTVNAARTWNAFAPDFFHFHDAAQLMLTMDNGCGVLGDVSYFMPDSMGYTLPHYWRMTFWGRQGVLETSATSDHIWMALNGESAPRKEALPPGNPAGYLHAFLRDIAGTTRADELTTADVLKSARTALLIQAVADQGSSAQALG